MSHKDAARRDPEDPCHGDTPMEDTTTKDDEPPIPTEAEWADSWFMYFSRKPIPGDGNCLFTTIADVLRHLPTELLAKVQGHLSAAGISRITVEDLKDEEMVRTLSVANIFRQTDRMKAMIKDWRYLYAMAKKERNTSLANDLRHMASIEHITDPELTKEHLQILYRSMRQKSTYWGTEFDLINLEAFLGIRFIVVDHNGKVQTIASDHPEDWEPSLFCLIYRRQVHKFDPPHFQILQWNGNGRRAFLPSEVPAMVVEMCRRALPKSTSRVLPWYITMDFKGRE
jgi:hypothetical protein